MRHIILFICGVAVAYWLAPYAHTLTPKQRYIEIAAVVAFFVVVDVVIGRAKASRKPAARSGSSPYAATGKRR